MIKTRKDNLVVLGLSDENMKRLADGQPIKINLKDLNLPDIEVVIFNGRTEETMYLAMLDLIGPKTRLQ